MSKKFLFLIFKSTGKSFSFHYGSKLNSADCGVETFLQLRNC